MNKFLLLVAACIPVAVSAQQKKQTITTTINKVTVFIKGAQITRTGNVSLVAGTNQVTIPDVSPDLEEKSIQVSGEGDFSLLAVSRQPNNLRQQTKRTEIATLEARQEKLKLQLQKEQNNEQVYTEEKNMLVKNQAVGGNNGLKATDLKEALDLQRARMTEVLAKSLEIKENITSINKELKLVELQLVALHKEENISTSDIILDISSKNPVSGKITVSYVVKNAGWIPSYDVRVTDINHPLNMLYKASVFQQCGEDWKDVKLSLSTGSPDESHAKPELQPWYLKYYSSYAERDLAGSQVSTLNQGQIMGTLTDDVGQPLPGATIRIKGSTIGAVSDANGIYRLQLPAGHNTLVFSSIGFNTRELPAGNNMRVKMTPTLHALQEVVATGYSSSNGLYDSNTVTSIVGKVSGVSTTRKVKSFSANEEIPEVSTPTTVTFDIPTPYSIPPDGKTYSVGIKELEIDANYQYYAVPKIEKAAFLTAAITDWESLNLLDGEASIFYEGTFIGKTLLDLKTGSDTLQISLGKDKQVIVNRNVLKDESKKHFMGAKTTFSRAWEISIRNNKQVPINITVQDQLPIKTSSDMDVSKAEYGDAVLDNDTKILHWVMQINPATEQKKQLKYAITYPKGNIVNAD